MHPKVHHHSHDDTSSCAKKYCLPSSLKRCHWGLSACMLIVSIIQIVQVTERLTQGDAILTNSGSFLLPQQPCMTGTSLSSSTSTGVGGGSQRLSLSSMTGDIFDEQDPQFKHLMTMAYTWQSIWDEWEQQEQGAAATSAGTNDGKNIDPRFSHDNQMLVAHQTKRQVFSNAITPTTSTTTKISAVNPNRDVALVTHASVSKLPHFVKQIQHWSGRKMTLSSASSSSAPAAAYVSVAIYFNNKDDISTFVNFYKQHVKTGIFDDVYFHFALEWSPYKEDGDEQSRKQERERMAEYPHNMLRNIAIEYLPSAILYYMMLDVDFVTPPNGHEVLLRSLFGDIGIGTDGSGDNDNDEHGSGVGSSSQPTTIDLLRNKTLLVIPAFEQVPTGNAKNDEAFAVPTTKSELITMYNDGKVDAFHNKTFPQGHTPTNYTKWMMSGDSDSTSDTSSNSLFYPISYEPQYEPYVIAYKHGIPKYWELFRGFGFDKLSHIMECYYAGYTFQVLNNVDLFVVHLHHELYKTATTHRHNNDYRKMANYPLSTFGEYLIDTYPKTTTKTKETPSSLNGGAGADWKKLKKIFGFSLVHTNDYNQREYEKLVNRVKRVYNLNAIMDKNQQQMEVANSLLENGGGGLFSSFYTKDDIERLLLFATPIQDRIKEGLETENAGGSAITTYKNKPLEDFLKKVEPLFPPIDNDDAASTTSIANKGLSPTVSPIYHPWELFFDNAIVEQKKKSAAKPVIIDGLDDNNKDLDYTYRKVIPHALPSKVPIDNDDITLAAHSSVSKLERLEIQLRRWNGPTSIAVYISNKDDIAVLLNWYSTSTYIHDTVTIHVVLEYHIGPTTMYYPHNILRNVALDNIQTDYFLAMDADFMTSYTCHEHLRNLIATSESTRNYLRYNKTLMVLPAFERFEFDTSPPLTIDDIPNTKDELRTMMDKELLAPFHIDIFEPGHGPSNYPKWFSKDVPDDDEKVSYPVEFQHRYEPYVLGYKDGSSIPRYWPFFRGFGFDKISWLTEAHYAGYQFRVLQDHFVVHMNHAKVNSATITHSEEHNLNMKRMFLYISYLNEAYPDTCKYDDAKKVFGSLIKRVKDRTENRFAYLGKRILLAYDKKWWLSEEDRKLYFSQSLEDFLNRLYHETAFIRQWLGKVEPKLIPPNAKSSGSAVTKPNFGHQSFYNIYEFEFGGFSGNFASENAHNISIPNLIPNKEPLVPDDITLVTHTSVDTLNLLLAQLQLWDGPASVAVYVEKPTDITALTSFYDDFKHNVTALKRSKFHVLMEDASSGAFPHSLLRNLATQNVETEYALNLDVDFVTPSSCNHDRLRELLQSDTTIASSMKNDGSLYLLPGITYESTLPDFDNYAETKNGIVDVIKRGEAKFSSPDPLPRGTQPTQIDEWLSVETSSKGIDASPSTTVYEPFVLGYARNLPTYWEQFRGEDYEKLSWNLQLQYSTGGGESSRLKILSNHFVVGQHTNHQSRKSRMNMPTVTEEYKQNALGTFAEHLVGSASSNVSWDEIAKRFGKDDLRHSDGYYIKERVATIRRVTRAYRVGKKNAMKDKKDLFKKQPHGLLSQPTEEILSWLQRVEPLVAGVTATK